MPPWHAGHAQLCSGLADLRSRQHDQTQPNTRHTQNIGENIYKTNVLNIPLSSLMSSVVCLDKKLFSFCCPGGWVRVSVGWWVSGGEKLGRYINLAIPAREISVST